MFRSIRGVSISAGLGLCLIISVAARAGADDVYFYVRVSDLKFPDRALPKDEKSGDLTASWRFIADVRPRAAIDGEGEVYLSGGVDARLGPVTAQYPARLDGTEQVAFRLPARREVSGKLFVPDGDRKGMALVAFKATPPPAQNDAKAVFNQAKRNHYTRLLQRNIAGAAWFRHQLREADSNGPAANVGRANATTLERSFNLFGGSQAIGENLQLDRQAPAANPNAKQNAERVKTDGIRGITVAEMDWAARLKGKSPALDPLAAVIPADQHALFFPGLKSAGAFMTEFNGVDLPVLGLLASHSEDRRIQRRYETQLGVSLADLGGFPGAGAIKSLAVTGSDPYVPSGTDIAILIETESPDELIAFLKSRLVKARHDHSEAAEDDGESDGVRYHGARTTDRVLSAYFAALDKVVAVTNSKAQLARLVEAAHGKTPRLAEQNDYRYFRDRYTRGDDSESAFLVLTDATIRRWCGPRWRIGSSRRVRAGIALAELQAVNLPHIVGNDKVRALSVARPGDIELGEIQSVQSGMQSKVYGTLEFQTPIVELPLDEVDRVEADAYERWRDGYQQNWRGVFDPIAVRLSVRPGKLAADVSVMPLIAGSQYKQLIELVGSARLEPDSGDRHPGSLVHAAMALDVKSRLFQAGNNLVADMTHVPQQVALGWLGSSVALYLDDDPYWAELAAAKDTQEFFNKNYSRVPIGAHVDVTNGAKLALFLTGLRAFVEQSAPNVTRWENREHKGQRYVCVSEAEGSRRDADGARFALYYFSTTRGLTLSLSEAVVKRAIERGSEKKAEPAKDSSPWLGKSLALQVSRRGFETVGAAGRSEYGELLQVQSWGNLPILNEWKRIFPDRDPVALHEAVWGATLVDPAGGKYVWNPRWSTMESTVLGHPGEPKSAHESQNPLSRFGTAAFGVSFEDGGLRAKTEVELTPKP